MKCWIKTFLILVSITLFAIFVIYEGLALPLVWLPVLPYEIISVELLNNCKPEPCKDHPFTDMAIYYIILFWIPIYSFVAWFICKIKSFSKGNNNE